MKSHTIKPGSLKTQSSSNSASPKHDHGFSEFAIEDNRQEATCQRQLKERLAQSPASRCIQTTARLVNRGRCLPFAPLVQRRPGKSHPSAAPGRLTPDSWHLGHYPSNKINVAAQPNACFPLQRVVDLNSGPATLEQAAKPNGEFFMKNNAHVGNAPNNNIGFAEVLDAGGWNHLANSPENFNRAHAYAEQFGGSGDENNVAWWPQTQENEWTSWEYKVNGHTGLAQIDDRKPGQGEKGNLTVNRNLQKAVNFIPQFSPRLAGAVRWGFQAGRPAFYRALSSIQKNGQAEWRRGQMRIARAAGEANLPGQLDNWLGNLFSQAGTHLINDMQMTYAVTTPGANAGASRAAGYPHTINAPAINVNDFGLQDEPEKIWKELVNQNVGVFTKANLAQKMNTTIERIPYYQGGDPAQELRPHVDGYGIPE